LIEIINKQLLLQLVGYLCYWQMGFNSVFKGLTLNPSPICTNWCDSHFQPICKSRSQVTSRPLDIQSHCSVIL